MKLSIWVPTASLFPPTNLHIHESLINRRDKRPRGDSQGSGESNVYTLAVHAVGKHCQRACVTRMQFDLPKGGVSDIKIMASKRFCYLLKLASNVPRS